MLAAYYLVPSILIGWWPVRSMVCPIRDPGAMPVDRDTQRRLYPTSCPLFALDSVPTVVVVFCEYI